MSETFQPAGPVAAIIRRPEAVPQDRQALERKVRDLQTENVALHDTVRRLKDTINRMNQAATERQEW